MPVTFSRASFHCSEKAAMSWASCSSTAVCLAMSSNFVISISVPLLAVARSCRYRAFAGSCSPSILATLRSRQPMIPEKRYWMVFLSQALCLQYGSKVLTRSGIDHIQLDLSAEGRSLSNVASLTLSTAVKVALLFSPFNVENDEDRCCDC